MKQVKAVAPPVKIVGKCSFVPVAPLPPIVPSCEVFRPEIAVQVSQQQPVQGDNYQR